MCIGNLFAGRKSVRANLFSVSFFTPFSGKFCCVGYLRNLQQLSQKLPFELQTGKLLKTEKITRAKFTRHWQNFGLDHVYRDITLASGLCCVFAEFVTLNGLFVRRHIFLLCARVPYLKAAYVLRKVRVQCDL